MKDQLAEAIKAGTVGRPKLRPPVVDQEVQTSRRASIIVTPKSTKSMKDEPVQAEVVDE